MSISNFRVFPPALSPAEVHALYKPETQKYMAALYEDGLPGRPTLYQDDAEVSAALDYHSFHQGGFVRIVTGTKDQLISRYSMVEEDFEGED